MLIKMSILRLSLSNIVIMQRKLMTKQERFISKTIAMHDKNLQSIVIKSDNAKSLLLQSLFDRQIQEYIHLYWRIPIEEFDKYIYRLNSFITHNPSEFDQYESLLDENRFL